MISPFPTHINISHMTFVVTQLQDFLFLEGSQIIKGFAVNMFLQTMFGESRPLRWYHTLIKVHCVSSCITSQGCVHKGVFVLPAWRPDSNKKKKRRQKVILFKLTELKETNSAVNLKDDGNCEQCKLTRFLWKKIWPRFQTYIQMLCCTSSLTGVELLCLLCKTALWHWQRCVTTQFTESILKHLKVNFMNTHLQLTDKQREKCTGIPANYTFGPLRFRSACLHLKIKIKSDSTVLVMYPR